MAPNPAFSIDGDTHTAAAKGFDAGLGGGTYTLALVDPTGIDTVTFSVEEATRDTVVTGGGTASSAGGSVDIVIPALGDRESFIVQALITYRDVTKPAGLQVQSLAYRRMIACSADAFRHITPSETDEYTVKRWTDEVNDTIDATAAGGGGGLVVSNVTPTPIGAATAGVGADASRYDHVHAQGVIRTGAVDLLAAAAYGAIGAAVAVDAQTTSMYEVNLEVSWPAHTVFADGSTPVAAALYARRLTVIVTRDASNGVVVVTDTGDTITGNVWNIGGTSFGGSRVLLRIVAEGGAPWGWKIEASRGGLAAEAAASATVTASITLINAVAWDSDATPEIAPNVKLSASTPQAIGTAAVGTEKYPAAGDHAHAMGAACTLINASGNCEVNATNNGVTTQSLTVNCDDFAVYAAGDCYIEPALGFAVNATSIVSIASSGNYCAINAAGDIYFSTNTGIIHHRHVGQDVITETLNYVGATSLEIAAGVTSFSDTWAQDGSAAGGVRTLRGQKGFGGFAGGDFIIGPGDGGTAGTNAPGNLRFRLGTAVSGVTGKVRFENEAGTAFLDVYRSAAAIALVDAGANSLTLQGGSNTGQITLGGGITTLSSSSGYVQVSTSVANIYLSAPATFGIAITGTRYRGQLIMPPQEVTFSTATTATLLSITMVDGEAEDLDILVTWFNSTDTQYGRIRLSTPPLIKCAAGTASNVVAAAWAAQEGDEAGSCSASINLSTNNVQIRFTTPDTDNRKVSVYVTRRKAGPTF